MYEITTTEVIENHDKAVEVVCGIGAIKPMEKVKVRDAWDTEYIVKKPYVKKYQVFFNPNNVDYNKISEWAVDKDRDYDELNQDEMIAVIDYCDFQLWCMENRFRKVYHLRDEQGANLGGIESEVFCTIQDAVERLEDTYFEDYFGEGDYDE